jgi:hypothetical protein
VQSFRNASLQRTLVAGALVIGALLTGGAAPTATAPQRNLLYADPTQPDLSGLWVVTGGFTFSPDESVPVLQGEYKALYERRKAAFDAGRPIDDVTADCLPSGLPHLLVVPYPFELMQTPGRVTLLYEYDSVVRRIPLDAQHPDLGKVAATFYGDSVGHWEKDTLVVDTMNIRPDTQVDYTGIPHSDALRVSERLRRKDAVTLENQITLTDAKAYAKPFTVTRLYRLRPKWKISEYACQENNRNATGAEGRTGTGVPAEK